MLTVITIPCGSTHLQEGYLLGEYPEIADFEQKTHYEDYEMDFGQRLIAKFRFNPSTSGKQDRERIALPRVRERRASTPASRAIARRRMDVDA